MKKTKYVILIGFLMLSFLGMTSPSVTAINEPVYGLVTYEVDRDANEVPTLDIHVEYVLDPFSGLNLTDGSVINHSYVLINDANVKVKTGFFNAFGSDDATEVFLTLSDIPTDDYYFALNFSSASGYNFTEYEKLTPFHIAQTAKVDYTVTPTNEQKTIRIECTTEPTYDLAPDMDGTNTVATYHIKKDDLNVAEGELPCTGANQFKKEDINVKFGSGHYYIWITFEYSAVDEVISTESDMTEVGHYIVRSAPLEDLLMYIIIIAAVLAVVIVIALVYAKRGHGRVESRKKKKVDVDKPVEVIEIDKTKTTKTKLEQLKVKEKGKTTANKDLIFSVPQWEEEELSENASTIESEETKATTHKAGYSLHCPKCNSWIEIDEYIKAKCPNCGSALYLAMYCPKDQKWFDVPEKGDYKCPICSGPLRTSDQ